MIKEQIQECIQKILDNELGGISTNNCPRGGIEKYGYMTAYRLSKYVNFYRTRRISLDDFLISLRNYLLVFQTAVRLPIDIDITDNKYGLRIDSEGLCYATLNLPDYLNIDIIKQGFMVDYVEPEKDERYFLGVTPNIYRLTGFQRFKSIRQKLAVNGALNMPEGYTALVSLPTGGGKSLITQAMAYQKNDGLTITVVPTVSLAMDQVRVARDNIRVAFKAEIACYYSDLASEEKRSIIDRIKDRKLRLLFISPEALIKNEVFKQVIETANDAGYLRNLIIDEAHIVIEWGNFFRVDYQCLEPWRNNLYEKNSKLKTVLLSATYERTTVKILQSMFATGDKWIEIRCDALRREPRFELVSATSYRDKNEKTRELLRCLPRPMVVYVMRPDQAEKVKEMAADIGITNVETFTGKTKSDERSRIIEEWSENKFDIIIATSAFGVGVDKSDVRTVLHLYVPDNPNAYYQELGRGGRDGLPCLSVMCVYPEEDLESAFVMTDKVLGSEKILGRWESMLNSHTSTRGIDSYTLDTSVKPNYNSVDYAEDTSTVDQKWNIYVILLLRRYNLIKILDMVVDPHTQVYFIRISILDKRLLQTSEDTKLLIEDVRTKEWNKNERAFKTMSRAVKLGKRMCWSEMFFNSTYSMVSEYCAGCDNHKNIVESDPNRFELVKKIPAPTRNFSVELNNMFASSNEAILFADSDNTELIGNALTILPADRETQGVLEAFLAYVTLGNGSWNFDNSAMMVYRVQTWVGKWKKTIIQTVNVFDNQSVDYQDCAIATEMIREIMQGVFTGTKVEGIPTTNLMAKNLKKTVQNSHCTEWKSLVNMLLNNDEKVKDVITQYYNIIQGNLKSSQVFIRATEFNSDVRKVQKAKLLIPDEQILLNDPIPQRREIREIYEKIYTRIPKVAEAEKEKANRLLEQIGMYLDYEDIDDEDIEDLIDKIKLFYETASSSLVNIHGNIQVLDGIKKDAKTISVAFSEVEKGIASTDDLDTLLMFSKDPLSKIERILSTLQAVQKDIEYVARDVEKRRGNIFVDNGGDLSTRYVESRNTIEADSKTVMDWKVM